MANTNYPSTENPQNRPVRNSNNGSAKSIIIGILAVFLLGTWGYLLYDKNKSSEQIQTKTVEVNRATSARDSVQTLYNSSLARLDTSFRTQIPRYSAPPSRKRSASQPDFSVCLETSSRQGLLSR